MAIQDADVSQKIATSVPVPAFDIREWVSSAVYRRGQDYYKNGRVLSFELGDDNSIRAEVEGDELYDVAISWNGDGSPEVHCTCPYDWEPLCKHAVAVILYWQEREVIETDENKMTDETGGTRLFNRDRYIAELTELERKKRRSQKLLDLIKILKHPKNGHCGEYLVASQTMNENYTVTIRDIANLGQTTCNCADYLVNELGTCKHVERVKKKVADTRGINSRGKTPKIWVSLKPRNTRGEDNISPYSEIHVHSNDSEIQAQLFSSKTCAGVPYTPDGYLRDTSSDLPHKKKLTNAIAAITGGFESSKLPEVIVSESVAALVDNLDADLAWQLKVKNILRAPNQSPEWSALKAELPIKLYPYQEEGILFATRNRRSFLGDDMGLGKTIQAIVASLFIKKLASIRKVLVFCPASLKFQWKREIEKLSKEKAVMVQGNRTARQEIYNTSDAMFLIVNYEIIFRDEELLKQWIPDMIILDEAQRIKNWETKTAKGIKRLKSPFALVLTGTPFENRLLELHSLCEFLHPRALGPMWRLLPTYGNLDLNQKLIGFTNLSHLRQKIAPFFLRREKKVVLSQLPDKIVNEYTVEISGEQGKHHDDYEAALAQILNKAKKRPLTPQEMKRAFMCLTAMRIISNALAQHEWQKFQPLVEDTSALTLSQIRGFHSPKLLEFRSIMEDMLDTPNAKFVIFSQWERMLLLAQASIRDLLMVRGMESVIFSGSLPTDKRAGVIERFVKDPKLCVFFSTDAGGLGLNLQESANIVINLETPWNPAVLEQRVARVHRLGQKRTVNVINLISTGCIEERVYAAVCNKRKLFDGLFDGKTEDVTFEKGDHFIEKLKELIDDVDEKASKAISTEVELPVHQGPENGRMIDISEFVQTIGSFLGMSKMPEIIPAKSLQVRIEDNDGELKLAFKKPPQKIMGTIKKLLMDIAETMG
ncbi:MAG: DEAD/DEAH box helicase [Deltaproteobacteria bacterium]|nr:DEAD/DEAH box helicase [Deltaproteobacteria bacterium]